MVIFNTDGQEREPNQNHTSKGDQPKWFRNNLWYKSDYMGYEALSEVVVSEILKKSNVSDFVIYEPVTIFDGKNNLNGCVSENFKQSAEILITLEKLHRMFCGIGLAKELSQYSDVKEKIKYIVNFVEEKTELTKFGEYLTTMLEIDALFLNEDRHTNNIAVIRDEKTKKFRLCPFFDNGLSLLSDISDYNLEKDIYEFISTVKAKPFDRDFNEQVEAAEELYGVQLNINLKNSDIENIVNGFYGVYNEKILNRVKNVLFEQKRKYPIYFA